MKRQLVVLIVVLALSLVAFAGDKAKTEKVSGYLVDVMCSGELAGKGAAGAAKHDKECLQMPDCTKSGYAVLTADNKVIKFDAKGNDEARKAIAASSKEKDFKVIVNGAVSGDTMAVASLQLE